MYVTRVRKQKSNTRILTYLQEKERLPLLHFEQQRKKKVKEREREREKLLANRFS